MSRRRGSSGRWLQEHAADPYVREAQATGWRSRAVYKLIEIDERDRLFRPGLQVVDLGAAPGGWSQYARSKVGAGKVLALDILPMNPVEGVVFVEGDFTEQAVLAQLQAQLPAGRADLVLSDMAPNMSGIRAADQARGMYLAELALALAQEVLGADGALLVKVFQGEGFDAYLRQLRAGFERVVVRKPAASRDRSREQYLLARGLRTA